MEGRTRVWKVATSGSSPARQITFGEKGDSQPQWSPDGKHISFVSSRGSARGEGADLPDARRRRRSVEAHRREGRHAWLAAPYSWSPDSTRIAYVPAPIRAAPKKKPTSRNAMTSACSRATSAISTRGSWTWRRRQSTRITEGTTYTLQGAPSWSPDGKRFVFGAATTPMLRDNRRDIYVADPRRQARREDQHELGQRRIAAMVAGRPHHRVGDRTEHARRRCPTAPRRA